MIKKIYRLKEREVKKVLLKGKPFFSYGVVLNILENKLAYNRFAIVIGAKSVNNNITRNYFRRRFYDIIANSGLLLDGTTSKLNGNAYYDFVFVLKKQTKLDKIDEKSINSFTNDINFIIKKVA
ncbi:MAG: ribonuclease P protein component [Candidatus Gracilibacteria bacterium]|nr:ribonuclease P protein component [Candidatus Gracilibacteria bacterium]